MTNDNRLDSFRSYATDQGLDPESVEQACEYARRVFQEGDDYTDEEVYVSWVEDDDFESDAFKLGLDLGKATQAYESYLQVRTAYEMGEIELWLAYMEPKSLEDWAAWEEEHGKDFEDRWKTKDK
jgi:hypothetical protein